jgi:hypothetical protein
MDLTSVWAPVRGYAGGLGMKSGPRAGQRPQGGVTEWASSYIFTVRDGRVLGPIQGASEQAGLPEGWVKGFHGVWHFYERLAVLRSPRLKTGYQICISAKQPWTAHGRVQSIKRELIGFQFSSALARLYQTVGISFLPHGMNNLHLKCRTSFTIL